MEIFIIPHFMSQKCYNPVFHVQNCERLDAVNNLLLHSHVPDRTDFCGINDFCKEAKSSLRKEGKKE